MKLLVLPIIVQIFPLGRLWRLKLSDWEIVRVHVTDVNRKATMASLVITLDCDI
jgi:hypothetical protein